MGLGKWVKEKMQAWLEIVPPPSEQAIVIQRSHTRELEIIRSQLWYNGDSDELHQFFHSVNMGTGAFWATAPATSKVRKIHSGLPAIIADTLAYIVKSDLDGADVNSPEWDEISDKIGFSDLVGQSVVDTLVSGDGAFKISFDTSVSPYPIAEFVSGDRVEFESSRGIISAVIFKTFYTHKSKKFVFRERYSKGRIESQLFDMSGHEYPLETVPELSGITPDYRFSGGYIMAVPLKFYADKKYRGRGKSIFGGGKSDCFDALDEIISQWLDAVRAGRVVKYVPLNLVPRDPETGVIQSVSSFGAEVITLNSSMSEQSEKIEVSQPDIKYEAFVSAYTNALLMCLQGLVSPATLGIDVGKMSSADAQREKKDVTGNTRNIITTALEKALPEFVNAILKTYDNMRGIFPTDREISVSFGEYGAPDFDSRVETVGRASAYGIMSIETQVNELWGSSKDEEWKSAEVQRILSEKGLLAADEPSVGGE